MVRPADGSCIHIVWSSSNPVDRIGLFVCMHAACAVCCRLACSPLHLPLVSLELYHTASCSHCQHILLHMWHCCITCDKAFSSTWVAVNLACHIMMLLLLLCLLL